MQRYLCVTNMKQRLFSRVFFFCYRVPLFQEANLIKKENVELVPNFQQVKFHFQSCLQTQQLDNVWLR